MSIIGEALAYYRNPVVSTQSYLTNWCNQKIMLWQFYFIYNYILLKQLENNDRNRIMLPIMNLYLFYNMHYILFSLPAWLLLVNATFDIQNIVLLFIHNKLIGNNYNF